MSIFSEVNELQIQSMEKAVKAKEQEWKELKRLANADELNPDRILEIKAEIAKVEMKQWLLMIEKMELEIELNREQIKMDKQ